VPVSRLVDSPLKIQRKEIHHSGKQNSNLQPRKHGQQANLTRHSTRELVGKTSARFCDKANRCTYTKTTYKYVTFPVESHRKSPTAVAQLYVEFRDLNGHVELDADATQPGGGLMQTSLCSITKRHKFSKSIPNPSKTARSARYCSVTIGTARANPAQNTNQTPAISIDLEIQQRKAPTQRQTEQTINGILVVSSTCVSSTVDNTNRPCHRW
jgi:hypothetical protein